MYLKYIFYFSLNVFCVLNVYIYVQNYKIELLRIIVCLKSVLIIKRTEIIILSSSFNYKLYGMKYKSLFKHKNKYKIRKSI